MKKLLSFLFIIQMVWVLTGCCCLCGKKPAEQPPGQTQPPEENSQPAK